MPKPGDVIVIDRLNVVHAVLGCVLAEFATVSTDMVDRLHDQNAGRPTPAEFTRAFSEAGIANITWPTEANEVDTRLAAERKAAEAARADRKPVSAGNPFLAFEQVASTWISTWLDTYRIARDGMTEAFFVNLYGSPVLQALMGLGTEQARAHQRIERDLAREVATSNARKDLEKLFEVGGMAEAAIRALVYVRLPEGKIDERGFSMLLTLVSSSNAENAETLWGFIGRYRPGVTPQSHPKLNDAVGYAIHYFHDFVLPEKKFRDPTNEERKALQDLRDALSNLPADATAEAIQDVVYEIGRRPPFLDEKKKAKDGKPGVSLDWFNMLYQVLLGQEKGPRFGSFVAVYGLKNTADMIDGALARSA